MTPLPRPVLLATALERARQGSPCLLTGPPGAGKTTLLHELAATLAGEGLTPIYLDLMGAASSPERFVATALSVLPPQAQRSEVDRLVSAGRSSNAAAVAAVFTLWSKLDASFVLLLDEATEIRSLAYFPGLREVDLALASALGARSGPTLLATSFPTLALRRWPQLERLEVGPFSASEIDGVSAESLLRASFGWARYVRLLLPYTDADLVRAWAQEMELGGRIELMCRHTYESLLLRSRGYGMSKAVLQAVAREEGLNLTSLVARIGRTPGAVRDYLGWLRGVDALVMRKKRYFYCDGMLRRWVLLHARGIPASAEEVRLAAQELIGAGAAGEAAASTEAFPRSRPADTLMEID